MCYSDVSFSYGSSYVVSKAVGGHLTAHHVAEKLWPRKRHLPRAELKGVLSLGVLIVLAGGPPEKMPLSEGNQEQQETLPLGPYGNHSSGAVAQGGVSSPDHKGPGVRGAEEGNGREELDPALHKARVPHTLPGT